MLKLGPEQMLFSAGVQHPPGSHGGAENHTAELCRPCCFKCLHSKPSPLGSETQDTIPSTIIISSSCEEHALFLIQQPLSSSSHLAAWQGHEKGRSIRMPLTPAWSAEGEQASLWEKSCPAGTNPFGETWMLSQ